MSDERGKTVVCPLCGQTTSDFVYAWSSHEQCSLKVCLPCGAARQRRIDAFRGLLNRRLTGLCPRTRNCLARAVDEFESFEDLLAASDGRLLELRNFGKVALAEFRSLVPEPLPVPTPVPAPPSPDPAVFWAQRPDILQVVGG